MPVSLTEKPDLKAVPKPVRDKVSWDGKRNLLTISTPLTEDEAEALKVAVTSEAAAAAIVQAAEVSRTTAIEFFADTGGTGRTPACAAIGLACAGAVAVVLTTPKCWNTHGICRPTTLRQRVTI